MTKEDWKRSKRVDVSINEYCAVHNWLRYHYGKPTHCEFCDGIKAKRFEWALKEGYLYEKKRENFIQLCPSCHRKYDDAGHIKTWKPGSKEKLREINNIPVIQLSKSGEIIKHWESGTVAAQTIGIKRSAIANCLTGRAITAGEYIWIYEDGLELLGPKILKLKLGSRVNLKKKVGKFDNNGNLLETYESITSAAKNNKISMPYLSAMINGRMPNLYNLKKR